MKVEKVEEENVVVRARAVRIEMADQEDRDSIAEKSEKEIVMGTGKVEGGPRVSIVRMASIVIVVEEVRVREDDMTVDHASSRKRKASFQKSSASLKRKRKKIKRVADSSLRSAMRFESFKLAHKKSKI